MKILKHTPRGLERILEHIETCARCQNRKRVALSPPAERFRPAEPDYEPALDRCFQVLESREVALARERGDAPGLFARLKRVPVGRQRLLVRNIGRALIGAATSLSYTGNDKRALLLISDALDLIDPGREPRLVLCALHNLSDYLINLGRLAEAQRVQRQFQSLDRRIGGPWLESRHLWVAGRLAFRLGHYSEAEVLLAKARAGFLSLGDSTDSTLVSRELALVGATAKGFA